jgi:hypothetical protein
MEIEWAVEDGNGEVEKEFDADFRSAIAYQQDSPDRELVWRYKTKWRKASEQLPN